MSTINTIPGINITEPAGYPEQPEASVQNAQTQTGQSFSDMLADAMRDNALNASITAGSGFSGIPGGFLPVQNNGLEQAIMSAVSSGQADDAQMALMMLCMMMQSNQDGEFSMYMQMMSMMIMQMQADKEALRNTVMSSELDPYILDAIDRGVFKWTMPDTTGTGRAVLPLEPWRPATPAITNSADERSPERYRAVINQFNVETAERYKPGREGKTYCNIFVWDVTRAMGAEMPLYTEPDTGIPRSYPDTKGARSMGAIAMCDWLSTHGMNYGWREVNAETAQMHANQGKPAITSAGGIGHVQVICPSRDGGYDPIRGVTIAQAGSIVTNYTHLSSTYNTSSQKSVRYWIHD